MRARVLLLGLPPALWAAWRRPFRVLVEGESMLPTLRPGDQLLCVRRRRVRRGDVVVVRPPTHGFEMVKRVRALPGEGGLGPDEYLIVGDNDAASTDGRSFGPVHRAALAGVVVLRYLPQPRLLTRRGGEAGPGPATTRRRAG